ncbi:MAG: hypothetical protein AVDCRST_MAG40-670, partial [uncultured Gemmatimonadaceae bacterium]
CPPAGGALQRGHPADRRARRAELPARHGGLHAGARGVERPPAREHGARGVLRHPRAGPGHRPRGAPHRARRHRVRRGDRGAGRARLPAHLAHGARPRVRRRDARAGGQLLVRGRRVGAGHRRPAVLPERRHEPHPRGEPRGVPRGAHHPGHRGGQPGAHAQRAGVGGRRALGEHLPHRARRPHRPGHRRGARVGRPRRPAHRARARARGPAGGHRQRDRLRQRARARARHGQVLAAALRARADRRGGRGWRASL